MPRIDLTVVELTLLVEALDEYIEEKSAADKVLNEGAEAKLAILDDLTDTLASHLNRGFDDEPEET